MGGIVTGRAPQAPSERDYQASIIDLAHMLGYRVAHFRAARTKHGWRTPVAADGRGWPDLVLARRDRLLAVELKSQTGRVGVEQAEWLAALERAGVECHTWRAGTDSLTSIAGVLR